MCDRKDQGMWNPPSKILATPATLPTEKEELYVIE